MNDEDYIASKNEINVDLIIDELIKNNNIKDIKIFILNIKLFIIYHKCKKILQHAIINGYDNDKNNKIILKILWKQFSDAATAGKYEYPISIEGLKLYVNFPLWGWLRHARKLACQCLF